MDAETEAGLRFTPGNEEEDAETALCRLLQLAAQLLAAPLAAVVLKAVDDPQRSSVTLVRLARADAAPLTASIKDVPRLGRLHARVLATGQPEAIPDLLLEAETQDDLLAAFGVRSALGVPLQTSGNTPLGSLWVLDTLPRTWQRNEWASLG